MFILDKINYIAGKVVCAQLCLTFYRLMDYIVHPFPLSMEFSRQDYWSGCHFLFQGIFLIQGWSLHFLHHLPCQVASLSLYHLGSPIAGKPSS